jgi:hypothetical protein
MHMTYFWKKMVLYLVIQSARQPRNDFIISGEISSGLHLVYRPFIVNLQSFIIRINKMCGFYNVR